MIRQAFGVVEEACDDFTGADLATGAAVDHAHKFTFEHTKLFDAFLRFN